MLLWVKTKKKSKEVINESYDTSYLTGRVKGLGRELDAEGIRCTGNVPSVTAWWSQRGYLINIHHLAFMYYSVYISPKKKRKRTNRENFYCLLIPGRV